VNRKDLVRGIFTEATTLGMASPSAYNSIDLDKFKTSSPKYDWKISKTVRMTPLKKTPASKPEVSPMSYRPDEKIILTSEPRYSYPKEKGKSFIQR